MITILFYAYLLKSTLRRRGIVYRLAANRHEGNVLRQTTWIGFGSGQDVQLWFSVRYCFCVQECRSEQQVDGNCPIFIRPIFIHSWMLRHRYIFRFLPFMNCDFQAPTLRSDDELTMRKGITHFFTHTTTICSRYIRKNTGRKLDNMAGKQSDFTSASHGRIV